MGAQFFLVRHAAHDNVGGYLAGRSPGIRLGEAGQAQARRLGDRLARERFASIHASPRERTQETAWAIAHAAGIGAVATDPRLDEIDFGSWSGQTFEALDRDPEWRRWNAVRSLARTPAGETMFDVQVRVVAALRELARDGEAVVLVTHADVIKAAVMFHLGLSLDAWPRLEISPASISILEVDEWGARLLRLNEPGG